MMKKSILSITTSGHGVGCALCLDGRIVAANTLERLTRKKYDIMLPISRADLKTFGWNADPQVYMDYLDLPFDMENDYSTVDFNGIESFRILIEHVLSAGGIDLKDVDTVAYTYRHNESAEKFFKEKNPKVEFFTPEHHHSHLCQAFLPSPFEDAAIMVIDGQGVPMARTGYDQLSGCLGYGKGNVIETLWEIPVRYSLGGFYSYITNLCGFKTNEECKTMGLASYGTTRYYDLFKDRLKFGAYEFNAGNWRRLLHRFFLPEKHLYSLGNYHSFFNRFEKRKKNGPYTETYLDIAHAGQKLVEEVMIHMANWLYEKTGSKNLCISGGVGLNCVANYKVLEKTKFENIFVYPNAGDNGLPVGQALYLYNIVAGHQREYTANHDYMGKAYSPGEVEKAVDRYRDRAEIEVRQFSDINTLYDEMAAHIADGKITSWWQGRSEYGPRALGNRSILADPRRKEMKDVLNSRVKFREHFRPFTPSVLKEKAGDYFTLDIESPFMLLAPYVKPGKADVLPAITHVDNTARVQTVTRDVNERYYDLIKAFERRTGIPVLLNTSFNVAGEPIVETPEEAIKCFLSTDIDVLGIDTFMLTKRK
jgi:carbamoyltransferase